MRLIAFVMPITHKAVIKRGEVRGEHHRSGEGDLQPEHRGAEKHEQHRREHLARHFRRSGDLAGVVEQPYTQDDRSSERDTQGLGGALEDRVQVPDVVGDDHRDAKGNEHRGAAAIRDGVVVEVALVRHGDMGEASARRRNGNVSR